MLINKISAEAADRWINGPMDKLTALEERLQRQLASAHRLYSALQARDLPPDRPDLEPVQPDPRNEPSAVVEPAAARNAA